ncbi:hypothetical protein JHD46_08235 [Sulfurimonas sp. SAG-AH-194-C20]|nr:hypothetical protein [Sulfurimonas sp. SAG-AH-194-C20]MDF1879623.1 hypothetical protein [Sulfurimonas sp. SAG-AH-194-C20]
MKNETNVIVAKRLTSGDPALFKSAVDRSTTFIRSRVREKGFARNLFEPTYVTAADLDRAVDSDMPIMILEKDMEARAYTVPFRGTGEAKYWDSKNFIITFHKYQSDQFTKSKLEMMTSKTSYDKLLENRIVEAMYRVEDEVVIKAMNAVVAEAETSKPGSQYLEVTGGLDKENLKIIIKMLSRLKMIPTEPGSDKDKPKFLMNTTLKQDLIDLGQLEIGDVGVAKNFNQGVTGVNRLLGLPIVTTIKDDLVPDDELFLVAPQDYSGRFMILQDHTLFVETKMDMISFQSYAAMGFGIVNTNSIVKLKFV